MCCVRLLGRWRPLSLSATLLATTSALQAPALGQGAPAQAGDLLVIPKTRVDQKALDDFRRAESAIRSSGSARINVDVDWSRLSERFKNLANRYQTPQSTPSSRPSPVPQIRILAPSEPTVAAPVSVLPLAEVQRATAQIQTYLQSSNGAGSALEALAKSRSPTPIVVVPVDAVQLGPGAQPGSLLGSGVVRPETGMLAGAQAVAAEVVDAERQGVHVHPAEIARLPVVEALKTANASNPDAAPLTKAYGDVLDSLSKMLSAPSDAANINSFTQAGREFRATYGATFQKLKTPEERRLAAEAYNALSAQGQLKSIYGFPSNFPPLSYRQIYHYSRRVVGVSIDGRLVCSGIAVDAHWVITAGHCLTEDPLPEAIKLTVERSPGDVMSIGPIVDRWPRPAPGASSEDPIDYVFLRVAPTEEAQKHVAALDDAALRNEGLKPFCILDRPLPRDEPVFAVGHPSGGEMRVHDHAYVRYPHRLSAKQFQTLDSETFARAQAIGKRIGDPGYEERAIKNFRTVYRKTVEGADTVYVYTIPIATDPAAPGRPSFGIDTDTFSGDSGAAVFDRTNQCIVGVFSGGEDDRLVELQADWRQHEFATPIAAVLKHLKGLDVAIDTPTEEVANKRRDLVLTLDRLKQH